MTGNEQEKQVELVVRLLEAKTGLSVESPVFAKTIQWINYFQGNNALRQRLISKACEAFQISEAQLVRSLEGGLPAPREPKVAAPVVESSEKVLDRLVPADGFFRHYIEYTRRNEAPLSYHLVSSMSVVGAVSGRNTWIDMGEFRIYPNSSAILIGPTGRVRKTTAIDIAKTFIVESAACPILSDKMTGEAMASALVQSGKQFLYAPEFVVFFGRQRYNEGLTTMIIRLMDCPLEYEVRTMARGVETILQPTLTVLGGSTLSLLLNSAPEEVTSSGFMNRFLLMIENDTERCFPIPDRGPAIDRAAILGRLAEIKTFSGGLALSPPALAMYDHWYRSRRKKFAEMSEMMIEVVERNHVHALRTALVSHLAQCGFSDICETCMKFSLDFIAFNQSKLPEMVAQMDRTVASKDTDYVLKTLSRLGGAADHSTLLRRVASRMNSTTFKQAIKTLEESGIITLSKKGAAQYYIMALEEDK